MTSDDVDLAGNTDLFNEPDDYYLPEKPATFVQHILQSGQELRLRLVGHNPLWV
jgi:EEF1A N-terminal glycine/lysine methyltransferase